MVVISNSWTQLSGPGNDGLLVSSRGSTQVEIGVTATNTAPQSGHVFDGSFVVRRTDVGNGYVWARIPDSSNVSTIELEVSKGGELPQNAISLSGPVTVSNEVEVKNDTGSPIPTKDTAGAAAATITTNTTAVTGTFTAITAIADTVFTSLTRSNTTGALGSVTVPAGVTIFGSITGYQLASGAVIAYGA